MVAPPTALRAPPTRSFLVFLVKVGAAALALIPGTNRGQFHTNGCSVDASVNAAECNGFVRRGCGLTTHTLQSVNSLLVLRLK